MKKLLFLLPLLTIGISCFSQSYKIIYSKAWRPDHAPYWLVIGKPKDCKKIINEVYHKLGTKKFSLVIVDDSKSADIWIKTDKLIHIKMSEAQYLEKHTIAYYNGLLQSNMPEAPFEFWADEYGSYEPK